MTDTETPETGAPDPDIPTTAAEAGTSKTSPADKAPAAWQEGPDGTKFLKITLVGVSTLDINDFILS